MKTNAFNQGLSLRKERVSSLGRKPQQEGKTTFIFTPALTTLFTSTTFTTDLHPKSDAAVCPGQ